MPSDIGGTAIIGYEVTLKQGAAVEQIKNSTSGNTVFTGLQLLVGESYTVEVVAANSVGMSDAASSTIDLTSLFLHNNYVNPIMSKWFSYFDLFLPLYQCSTPSTWWCDCHGYLGLIHHCHMDPSSGACQWCPCHCIHSDCSPQQWLHCADHIFYHQHRAQWVAGGHHLHHPGGGT